MNNRPARHARPSLVLHFFGTLAAALIWVLLVVDTAPGHPLHPANTDSLYGTQGQTPAPVVVGHAPEEKKL